MTPGQESRKVNETMQMRQNHTHHTTKRVRRLLPFYFFAFLLLTIVSCAKMGQPDGGWFDERPPQVIGATPEDKAVNVKANKIIINFDEYVKIENATENVVVSPPQLEMPEIKGAGKRIIIELKDTLKPNTTYTVDFSDAITDNNESNPLGNYTYSFSTGEQIDTMEVSGHVLEAADLEPVKGILVGLYNNLTDTIFQHEPLLRVARTDSRGHFVIKGIAPGSYRIYALQDADGNYFFNQKSEKIAFNHDIVVPSSFPDTRPDTIWRDSLHIESIQQVPYTHFIPDNIVLRAFTEVQTDRFYLKRERQEPDHFTLFFSYGSNELPRIKGLNFDADSAFVVEPNERQDTITYWLRDTMLINQDTLRFEMDYLMTDSTGALVNKTDTVEAWPKESYEKRMKKRQKEYDEWKKKAEKAEKKGQTVEPFRREEDGPLRIDVKVPNDMDPEKNVLVTSPVPLESIDTAAIHLYVKEDTLWYNASMEFLPVKNKARTYQILGEWRPEGEYSLEIDSAAFRSIYGRVSEKIKKGIKLKSNDEYSTLIVTLVGMKDSAMVVQLLNKQDKPVKELTTRNGVAEFFYVKPETYYLRAFVDYNGNGVWDTGCYEEDLQPEPVFYFDEPLECRAKWDVSRTWNPKSVNVAKQKPAAIVQQKADKKKTIRRQNHQRAQKLGIKLPDELKILDSQLQLR